MSDHYHHASEIQGAADDRHGHPDLERDISGVESDLRNHRHFDLEREDQNLKSLLDRCRVGLRDLLEQLDEALGRIRALEEQTPEARQLELEADLAAADREAWGGKEPSASYEEWVAEGRATTPEIGAEPEADDEGGVSEYRYVLPEDYERGQS